MLQSTTNTARRAQLLDGAAVAAQIKLETAREVERLWKDHQVKPCLAAVLVGDDPAFQSGGHADLPLGGWSAKPYSHRTFSA